jgi:hypothetical protein
MVIGLDNVVQARELPQGALNLEPVNTHKIQGAICTGFRTSVEDESAYLPCFQLLSRACLEIANLSSLRSTTYNGSAPRMSR